MYEIKLCIRTFEKYTCGKILIQISPYDIGVNKQQLSRICPDLLLGEIINK